MEPVKQLRFMGKYPMKLKRVFLGTDREGEEHYEKRVFMYLGPIRLDCSAFNPAQVELIVKKLELMGLTGEPDGTE